MLKFVNLKDINPSVEQALAIVEIEIENATRENISVIKVLHGYGSHGRGGAIFVELRKMLNILKKKGQILDFFGGDNWNLFNEQTQLALMRDKTIALDEDMNKNNPGITIILTKQQ